MRLIADPLAQCGQEARFADAGLAREQHDLAFACLCLVPAPQQQRQFLLAADQSCNVPPMQRLKTVFDRAFPDDLPDSDRFGKAGECNRPALFALKEFTYQAPCGRRNEHRTRCGVRDETSGKARRLAQDRLLS